MKPGDQVLVIDGHYQGMTGILLELDPPWVSIRLRDGRNLFCASCLVKVCDNTEGSN